MSNATILFIDDEEHIRIANRQTLELAGFSVQTLATADKVPTLISTDWFGVVVCDIRLPGMDGLQLLQRARELDPELPVILITGHGDIQMAVGAIQDGAYDFIEKPFAADRLLDSVRRANEKRALTLENRRLRSELLDQSTPGPRLIGRAPGMQQLRATIAQVADTKADILILGETGTGKEMVARMLHEQSRRRSRNFVAVNCGAVPESMIESELFGHEAGAFTGAAGRRIGKFEHADGGTLFLDEIESMPMSAQVRLLRVLQDRAVERLGSNELTPLDFRVAAATKVDLRQAADGGGFREDLYYRLNVVTIEIPPLRQRREDIPLLFHHFLLTARARYDREVPAPPPEQMSALMAHDWPGNVRELRNAAERCVLLGGECPLILQQLLTVEPGADASAGKAGLPYMVECFEQTLIEQALAASKGSIKETMAALGVPRKTLYDKMQKYGLDKNRFKDSSD
ncbi:MAG: sigma-54 dependent transcriptional regulator [Thiohalocapsa sp.]